MQLQQIFSQAEEINIYRDGAKETCVAGDEKFEEIMAAWNVMTASSVTMPAFGVSLNEHTAKAVLEGVWAEFCFAGRLESEGMPFERLLIEAKPEYCGFNVNRYLPEYGYQGRCFYIDLRGGTMHNFYDTLVK